MDILKELFLLFLVSMVYLACAGLLVVSVFGRSVFPDGNLIDILITAFN